MKLKIKFYLKSGVKNQIPIIALVSFGYSEFDVTKQDKVYKPLRYYTGFKVELSDWDSLNKKPKQKSLHSDLLLMERQINEVYNLFVLKNEELTPQKFKEALDVKIKGKKILDVLRIRMIDFIENNILTSDEFKKKTKDNYKSISQKIEDLEKRIGKPVYANDVNEDLFKLFLNLMRERSFKHNTVWSCKKDFLSVLNKIGRFYKIKVFNPGEELDKKDKITSIVEDKIYLNFEQIKSIIDYKPETNKMKNTKLIFLTLLFSGCRFSDVFKVKPDNLFSKDKIKFHYAHFITQKGQKEVIIPILKPLMSAIEENGGKTAHKIGEPIFNVDVKVLIEKCGLDKEHILSYTDANGKKQFEKKPFHDFVSSHTGRRSFITNLINDIPITILCKITTHELKDNSIIFDYNKISLLENSIKFVRQLKRERQYNKEHFIFDLV